MKIKLQEALDLIQSADVVRLTDGGGYINPSVSIDKVRKQSDNEVLFMGWEDQESGFDYSLRVIEGNNAKVKRDGNKLTLIDDEGEPFELQLFRTIPMTHSSDYLT